MDRSVTVRYFQIEAANEAQNFPDAVDAAYGLGRSPHQRERTVRTVARVRLESVSRRRGLLFGVVVRVQTDNIPPEARQAGLVPLSIGGLGHSVAFCFDERSSVLAIQFDPRGVSLGLFLDYLAMTSGNGGFVYLPIINDDAWERYNRGQPRSLTLSIAAPQQLGALDGVAGGVLAASKRLAEITNAPIVTIEVSMGHAKGGLLKNAVDRVVQAFSSEESEADVRSLVVKTKSEGVPTDEIDFIKDLARDRDVLDLPSDDHEKNLRVRYAFLERSFLSRIENLREMYA